MGGLCMVKRGNILYGSVRLAEALCVRKFEVYLIYK